MRASYSLFISSAHCTLWQVIDALCTCLTLVNESASPYSFEISQFSAVIFYYVTRPEHSFANLKWLTILVHYLTLCNNRSNV